MGVRDEATQSGSLEAHIGLLGGETAGDMYTKFRNALVEFQLLQEQRTFMAKKVLLRWKEREKSELTAYYGSISLPKECNSVESVIP